MAEFRKWFPALALVVLLLGFASDASAQAALVCTANAGVPPLLRAEGITELTGDIILNCTGGIATPFGTAVPTMNFQIFLNTNVTSRLVADPTSEALLMIDEPQPAQQRIATTAGVCATTATGAAGDPVNGIPGGVNYSRAGSCAQNVYPGRQVGANSISWLGVPIDAPGTAGTRVIRMTNVRSNASQLGVSSTLVPSQVVALISVSGTTALPINNPQQTVGFVQPGLIFSSSVSLTAAQCVSLNAALAASPTDQTATLAGTLSFGEGFATAFKMRHALDGTGAPIPQNSPGVIYNTESGFTSNALFGGTLDASSLSTGVANYGTRVMARFSNIPAGVSLFASTAHTSGTSVGTTAVLVSNADSNGGGGTQFTGLSGTGLAGGVPILPIALSGGSGTAVWEVTASNPNAIDVLKVGVAFAYTANTAANLPALTGSTPGTVRGSFAPVSTVTTASATAPIPRFVESTNTSNTIIINPCRTNLLFPFVSNQSGFDTGIAISNTSRDPFGTITQAGPCTINYYGGTTGGGAAPAAQTTSTVAAGSIAVFSLSSGGSNNITPTSGFQGYIIAQCNFQYAHGFAFISDLGAQRLSHGYLALVMDAPIVTRGSLSETLGQ